MKITKDITTIRKEVETLRCDRCKKTDIIYSGKEMGAGEIHVSQFKSSFGYGSDLDQKTINFDLCDDCLFAMLDFAKIEYRITPDDDDE